MNIFFIEPTLKQSAISLDNARINKMIIETCQMLCTTLYINHPDIYNNHQSTQPPVNQLYKPTHMTHPCVKWLSMPNTNHYHLILTDYLYHLINTAIQRGFKPISGAKVYSNLMTIYTQIQLSYTYYTTLDSDLQSASISDFTHTPPLAMPSQYHHNTNSVTQSYRGYYIDKPLIRYILSDVPMWFLLSRKTPISVKISKLDNKYTVVTPDQLKVLYYTHNKGDN